MSQIRPRREERIYAPDNDLGWTDGRTDGQMDGWMDGWMDRLITKIHPQSKVLIISVSEHQKNPTKLMHNELVKKGNRLVSFLIDWVYSTHVCINCKHNNLR